LHLRRRGRDLQNLSKKGKGGREVIFINKWQVKWMILWERKEGFLSLPPAAWGKKKGKKFPPLVTRWKLVKNE